MTEQRTTNQTQRPPTDPVPNGERSRSPRTGHGSLNAKTILGILREQGIPDSEARRRVNSDPSLHRQLD